VEGGEVGEGGEDGRGRETVERMGEGGRRWSGGRGRETEGEGEGEREMRYELDKT
jgi:hypothetical protein